MNLRFGINRFGRYIFAAPIKDDSGGTTPDIQDIKYYPDLVQITSYNKDGTKSAIFGSDTEKSTFSSLTFEITTTGCGAATLVFKKQPSFDKVYYGQRIDISLFGDVRPWWSGYVLNLPAVGHTGEISESKKGGTEKEYKIVCSGYFNILDKKQIFGHYINREISDIVIDICRQAEHLGPIVNTSKIYNTGYRISEMVFDGVSIKECLKQLSEFAVDWVYGVDEFRHVFFKPRNDRINEEARFWVGPHLKEYLPTIDVDKIVNWARIKGAKIDEEGEQWLTIVEDLESQEKYGKREAVWTLPTTYSSDDAERWGLSELSKYKDPIESAKVKGLKLEYPKPDGEFWVRKLSTDGQALITNQHGISTAYPITKLKYTINASKGIVCDMDLGTEPFILSDYFKRIERDNLNNELLQQASNKQLK